MHTHTRLHWCLARRLLTATPPSLVCCSPARVPSRRVLELPSVWAGIPAAKHLPGLPHLPSHSPPLSHRLEPRARPPPAARRLPRSARSAAPDRTGTAGASEGGEGGGGLGDGCQRGEGGRGRACGGPQPFVDFPLLPLLRPLPSFPQPLAPLFLPPLSTSPSFLPLPFPPFLHLLQPPPLPFRAPHLARRRRPSLLYLGPPAAPPLSQVRLGQQRRRRVLPVPLPHQPLHWTRAGGGGGGGAGDEGEVGWQRAVRAGRGRGERAPAELRRGAARQAGLARRAEAGDKESERGTGSSRDGGGDSREWGRRTTNERERVGSGDTHKRGGSEGEEGGAQERRSRRRGREDDRSSIG